ncbi:methionyl-tRNA formyltransferase [Salinibacterium hongtaonis]|uniref:methionyl-tRNA formyltransferase n=1 Tax=Homoserinimonas hongtaonis TaxID=2079791 RepID=UPI000D364E6E|nr:methionyl-tRNA formyltransferase [Salinibacterium hongtaonis]AWB89270.1 methionyl-tRNA formyltransferase [Salinibacterium hongtaonis]
MRLVFAGSPSAAVPSLRLLAASQHEIAAVISREDSPQGRKRIVTPTAVAAVADELGVPVIKANRLDDSTTQAVADIRPDLGVIVAYGGLVKEPLLSTPRLGWINLHFSLLPRWRGAAPVQRAIMAGDEVTGATVFQLVEELDAGDIFGMLTQTIGPSQTAGDLLDSLSHSGAELLLRVVDALEDGTARADAQHGDITVAPKLTIDDGRVNFADHASMVLARIRGVTPEPGAFAELDGVRVKVLEAAPGASVVQRHPGEAELIDGRVLVGTATEAIELVTVQPAGKKPMKAADWWRGRPSSAATKFEVSA